MRAASSHGAECQDSSHGWARLNHNTVHLRRSGAAEQEYGVGKGPGRRGVEVFGPLGEVVRHLALDHARVDTVGARRERVLGDLAEHRGDQAEPLIRRRALDDRHGVAENPHRADKAQPARVHARVSGGPSTGNKVFDLNCANCHATQPGGPLKKGPNLSKVGAERKVDEVLAVLPNGSQQRTAG